MVDDHAGYRGLVAAALRDIPQIELAAEAASGREACDVVDRLHPDVVVMDLSMPGMSGLDATRVILDQDPATHVIVLTASDGADVERDALAAGAERVVTKMAPLDDVVGVVLDAVEEELDP